MLLHAKLEQHVERERSVIVGEFKREYSAQYKYDLDRRMYASVFPNTFLSRMTTPLGTLDSIQSLTQRDLQQFYDEHYTPANINVVAVGELTADQVVEHLARSPFAAVKHGVRTPRLEPVKEVPYPAENLEIFALGDHVQGLSAAKYSSVAQLPGILKLEQLGIFYRMLSRQLFNVVRQKNLGRTISAVSTATLEGISGSLRSTAMV
jgi:predicted Zn-dependent peptidase